MSQVQIVSGKGVVLPRIIEGRNPFDAVYKAADEIMGRTEYIWVNRRQIGFQWDYTLNAYKLVVRDDHGGIGGEFIATKSAISTWAQKANSTLSRSVWTIVSYTPPGENEPIALAVLTDQYAILSYTDIIASIEKVASELSHDNRLQVQRIEMSPDHMNVDLVMADLAIPTELQQVGDVLSVGVQVRSSLTGKAAVSIAPYCIRLACRNRMTTALGGGDTSVRFIHRWGGMRYDIGDAPLTERNIRWLQERASARLGYKYRNALRQAVFSNLEDAVNIVRGAAVAANTPLTEIEATRRLSSIIDMWIGEAPSEGVDFRKADFKDLESPGVRLNLVSRATAVLQQYGAMLGYSMYSIIQALTERKILMRLPDAARAAIEDWAARYCIKLSDQYDPKTTPVENISSEDINKILEALHHA